MTTVEVTEVSIDTLVAESSESDARSFLAKYRKHICNDVYIANYYANLTAENLQGNFELTKARLVSLQSKTPDLKFNNAPRVLKTARITTPKTPKPKSTTTKKKSMVTRMNYIIEFQDAQGNTVDRLGASDSGDSVHRASAKLAAVADYAQAVYYSPDVVDANGKPIKSVLTKLDAIASVYKKKGGPAMKNTSSYSSKLEWGGKAKNDHFHFSKG